MIFWKLFFVFILFTAQLTHAAEVQLYGGANSTTFDDASDADKSGLSLRLQYNFADHASGWIANLNAPGQSILVGEYSVAYELKTSGNFFVEAGLGASYSRIWGASPLLILGFGYRVSQNFFFDFPIMATTSSASWLPYLGFTF